MKTYLKYIFLFSFLLTGWISLMAQDDSNIPDRPNPPRLVNNFSQEFPNFLSAAEEAQLEARLVAFGNETSNQITIVIIDDLGGEDPSQFSSKLGDKWGVGQAKLSNGVVVLIKPSDKNGKHGAFISPGRGLSGAIPDLACKRIVEEEINPNFRNKNYFAGLNAATDKLMALAKGEINTKEYAKQGRRHESNNWNIGVILLFILIYIIFNLINRRRGGGYTMGRGGFYTGGFLGGFGGGGFGGGGSSGGGGFGGFGGGSFGGGGSGGSW